MPDGIEGEVVTLDDLDLAAVVIHDDIDRLYVRTIGLDSYCLWVPTSACRLIAHDMGPLAVAA